MKGSSTELSAQLLKPGLFNRLPITRKLKGIYLPGNIFWFRQGTERSERWSALPGTCIRKAWRSQVLPAQTNSKKQQDPDRGSASSGQDAITGIQGRSPLWAWHPARLFLLCPRDWVLKIRGYAECGGRSEEHTFELQSRQ